jgi:hypothetical protein
MKSLQKAHPVSENVLNGDALSVDDDTDLNNASSSNEESDLTATEAESVLKSAERALKLKVLI